MKTVNVVEAVFFAALEKKEAGERAAYLDQACSGDPDLRRCVEKLLAAQPKVGAFLQAPAPGLPAAGAPPATVDLATDARPGTVLGPYKLLHEIGEGGMGTVWMAEQDEPIRRRVALKVIKPGMDSRQILARFEAERQALALMDHPNIAKVLDAGATDGGRPYFVMELVKGQPITEFCDRNRLTTRERLELFVAVCNAIQHAHQKGVIHRDIKPSNVLVALYDGKPVPKVIDFGVAKAVGDPLTDKTLFTRHGQVVGTFEYMSPEQATLDQVDIDTRSDVYALGVLLYELLTGTTPLDKDELRRGGLAEVLRRIREEEPPKPSTRLTSSPGLLATAAAHRKTDSQKLPRAVRGELDWIVMKALDKDRNRRFATPNSLANDVERYLHDEPVRACPPTLGYRMRKWIRKNKVAFATASAVAAALVVGLALTSWQAVRATRAERNTAAALDRVGDALDDANKARAEAAGRLTETNAALDQLRLSQKEMRANQYAWDIQSLPLNWDAGNAAEVKRILERHDPDLRGFEWHYWNRLAHPERASFVPPGLPEDRVVSGMAGQLTTSWLFSGDGARVAYFSHSNSTGYTPTSGDDKPTLMVWDVATRKLLLTHEIPVPVVEPGKSLSISGSHLLSGDGKRVLVSARTVVGTPNPSGGLPRQAGPHSFVVRVLDVDSGKALFDSAKVLEDEHTATGVRLSRDGGKLLTMTRRQGRGESQVWDLGAPDKQPVIIKGALATGGFSPDGTRVLGPQRVGGKDVTKVWEAASGKELLSLDVPNGLVYSPGGTYLAAAVISGDSKEKQIRTLKVFDANTGKEVSSAALPGPVSFHGVPDARPYAQLAPPAFTRDESLVAVAHSASPFAGRWDWFLVEPATGKVRRTLEDLPGPDPRARSVRLFSGDGKQFVFCTANTIRSFDVASGRPVHTLRGHSGAIAAAVALADDHMLRTIEEDGTVKDWDLNPPAPPMQVAVMKEPNPLGGFTIHHAYAISDGGAWVARSTLSIDKNPDAVRVWAVAGKEPTVLTARPRRLPVVDAFAAHPVYISADGKRVALFRHDARSAAQPPGGAKADAPRPLPPSDVTVWDVASQKELLHLVLPLGNDESSGVVRFSPDGTTLAVVRRNEPRPNGDNKTGMKLWSIDVDTGRESPPIAVAGSVAGQSFSPDGKRIAGIIRPLNPRGEGRRTEQFAVWDLASGSQVFAAEGGRAASFDWQGGNSTAPFTLWSPDGTRVLFSDIDTLQLPLLDAATGKLVRTLRPANRGTFGPRPVVAFSPDGKRLACHFRQPVHGPTAVTTFDTDSGKELLSLPVPPGALGGPSGTPTGAPLTFTPDGHRLLCFEQQPIRMIPDAGGKEVVLTALRVTAWDATPLPEPKQP